MKNQKHFHNLININKVFKLKSNYLRMILGELTAYGTESTLKKFTEITRINIIIIKCGSHVFQINSLHEKNTHSKINIMNINNY